MEKESGPQRSRRTVLRAAVGTALGVLATSLGRAAPAEAADGEAVLLGTTNTAASSTVIAQPSLLSGPIPAGPVLRVDSSGDGLTHAIEAHSKEEFAIVAEAIMGGVLGTSSNGPGVAGQSLGNVGVLGLTETGIAVQGITGLGTAASFRSDTGTALLAAGLVRLSRSGRVTVGAGHAVADIDLRQKGGLSGTPLCFANLMTYRPGVYVIAVRPNYPVAGKARIYLNRAVTGATHVAWVVLNPPVPEPPPDPNGP